MTQSKVKDLEVLARLKKARSVMVLDHPFFASLALQLTFKEDVTCQTLWTDGKYIGYNPDYVKQLPFKQVLGVVGHETLHPAFLHPFRRGDREFMKWNVACDYAINIILADAGFELPEGVMLDSRYRGQGAEKIYGQLPPQPPQGQGGQSGEQGGDVGGTGVCRDAPNPADPNQKASAGQMEEAAQEWKIKAQQAAQQARAMGNCPAGVDRFIDEMCNPKADWREILSRFMDTVARNDYRWTPPNRRYVHQDLYYPSLYSEEVGELFFVLDTSGSISSEELKQFAGEVNAILDTFPGLTIKVLYCDTEVAGVETFSSDELPVKFHPKGGGGTDFRPPFEWIEQRDHDPVCLLYLTDLECSRYPEEPHYPVLWVHIGNYGETPPFGEYIKLEGGDE
jgi:predicted metal-dependent peptidase